MEIYRINVICFSAAEKDRQGYFLTEDALFQCMESVTQELHSEEFLMTTEKAEIPAWHMRAFRNWLLFGAGHLDGLDLKWETMSTVTHD
jgi:hypothetical protein